MSSSDEGFECEGVFTTLEKARAEFKKHLKINNISDEYINKHFNSSSVTPIFYSCEYEEETDEDLYSVFSYWVSKKEVC